MVELSQFDKSKLDVLQNLVGKQLKDIFKQLDFFIINFGDNDIEYSLHVYSFIRVINGHDIVLTSSDEYYRKDNTHMTKRQYKHDEMHKRSLLSTTINNTKALLNIAKVQKIVITDTADISIIFDNNIKIEIFNDALGQDEEWYRFFESKLENPPHYIVKYYDNVIILEKISPDYTEEKFCFSQEILDKIARLDKKNNKHS